MATTYTNTLKLAKQGSGENANTWGTILNDNVIQMVDNAFSTNISGSIDYVSAGDITLTRNDGAGDQSKLTVIGITGTQTSTSTVNLIVPTFTTASTANTAQWGGKMYIVRNPNSFTVVVKNAGNIGSTVPKNATMGVLATPTTVVPLFTGFAATSAKDTNTYIANQFVERASIGTSAGSDPSFNFGRITQSSISATSFNDGLITNLSATGTATFAGHATFSSIATFDGDVSVNKRSMCAITTIVCSATTTIDLSLSNFFFVRASGAVAGVVSVSLVAPVNGKVGQTGAIYLVTGTSAADSTFSFPSSAWKFPAGVTVEKTASAGSIDLLTYFVRDVSTDGVMQAIDVAGVKDFKS
jgi:hypothetical protein